MSEGQYRNEEPSGAERRVFPRLQESCTIRVKPIDGADSEQDGGTENPAAEVEALTVNISNGGLCYKADEPVPHGSYLAVELSLTGGARALVALARAAYCEDVGDGHEVGIEFLWVSYGDQTSHGEIADRIEAVLAQDVEGDLPELDLPIADIVMNTQAIQPDDLIYYGDNESAEVEGAETLLDADEAVTDVAPAHDPDPLGPITGEGG